MVASMEQTEKSNNELVNKVIGCILTVVILAVTYMWFVNSSFSMDKFFGFISFRLPFENTEHYCTKVAQGVLTLDTDEYYNCMFDNGTADEALQAWWHKQGVMDDEQAKCAADVTKKYLTDQEIETVLDGNRIDRVPDLEGMINDMGVCADL